MIECFLCGSNENISNGGGFRQLHGLQSKSNESMKCVLNNLIVDSGIAATDKDVVCLHCEVLCRELDAMEHERLVMRKIMRRLIHCTYRVNNLDRAWCQLDHKALGQFKLNGTCYQCKKCDFKTKRFAHITPHHTFHQIQDRKGTRTDKVLTGPELHNSNRHNVSPKKQTVRQPIGTNLRPEGIAQRNEIFEFNIDSHEGDCLYSMEEVSIKCTENEKNDEFEYDLYYPGDCDDENSVSVARSQEKSIEIPLNTSQQDHEMSDNDAAQPIPSKKTATKCRRLEYLYALHCGCTHCEQLPTNRSCEKAPKERHDTFTGNICGFCSQHFAEESSLQRHGRWCRIKSALKHHATSVDRVLKSKGKPQCSKWLDKGTCPFAGTFDDDGVDVDDDGAEIDDDFYDLGAVNIEDIDMHGEIFDEKFELFLQKTMMRLNTIDIEFVPV